MAFLRRREKIFIEAVIVSFFKTGWVLIFSCFIIFKFIVKGFYKLAYKTYLYFRYRKSGIKYSEVIDLIENCSPREFEILCANAFRVGGHKVRLTDFGNDYGRDIIVDGEIFVECKHYSEGNSVGREICQKLIGSCAGFNIQHGIVITTGTIHQNAIEYADRINKTGNFYLDLWDKEDLIRYINKLDKEKIYNVVNLMEG